jgi:hypothetical protein
MRVGGRCYVDVMPAPSPWEEKPVPEDVIAPLLRLPYRFHGPARQRLYQQGEVDVPTAELPRPPELTWFIMPDRLALTWWCGPGEDPKARRP